MSSGGTGTWIDTADPDFFEHWTFGSEPADTSEVPLGSYILCDALLVLKNLQWTAVVNNHEAT